MYRIAKVIEEPEKIFKNFLIYWIQLCSKPTGNTITLSNLNTHFIDSIKKSLEPYIIENTESKEYLIIEFADKNIIKIKLFNND